MPISNPVFISPVVSTSEEVLNILASEVLTLASEAVLVVVARTSRRGLTIQNDSDEVIYFDSGNQVSTTRYMFCLSPGAFYEMPYPAHHSGLYCISANGTANKRLHVREIAAIN